MAVPAFASSLPFTDIEDSDYHEAIEYVYEHGIMNGVTATTFNPTGNVERAMAITILYRLAGKPDYSTVPGFTDIDSSRYYYDAVCWASELRIAKGITATTFEPHTTVSLQQLLVFLYRYASREICADYLHRFMTLAIGDGRVSAQTTLSRGQSEDITEMLRRMMYTPHCKYDLYPIAMEFAFYNSSVIFSHSHGSDVSILLNEKRFLASQIDPDSMQSVELVYISACYAGGTFCETLYTVGGAQAVFGFTSTASASTDSNGIHYFNRQFFCYLSEGYSYEYAYNYALRDVLNAYSGDSGAEFLVSYPSGPLG